MLDFRENVDELIAETFKKCNITAFPFDCEKVLNTYGYTCKAYSSLNEKKKKICFNISNDACIIDRTIYFNDTALKSRIRFTLMHELGHILLNHTSSSEKEEDEADYFASCILAPRIMIHNLPLLNHDYKITAESIHKYFDISIAASNRALNDYHRWLKNMQETTGEPSDIEISIKNIFIKSEKNKRKKRTNQKKFAIRYLLDPSNDEYFIQQMERRRTEPY